MENPLDQLQIWSLRSLELTFFGQTSLSESESKTNNRGILLKNREKILKKLISAALLVLKCGTHTSLSVPKKLSENLELSKSSSNY